MVKNGYTGNGCLNFAWDLGVIFLGLRKFRRNIKGQIWGVREEGVSCFHIYRFWGSLFFFYLGS